MVRSFNSGALSLLLDLFSQGRLLLLERLVLLAQLSGLMRFENSRTGEHGNGGGDNSFLKCRHGNGFSCGNYG